MGKTSSTVKNRYNAKAYDQLPIRVPKGQKATIQAEADQKGEALNRYVNKAVLIRMGRREWPVNGDWDEAYLRWYQNASGDEKMLRDAVGSFEDDFADMLFSPGSITHKAIVCQSKTADGEWVDDVVGLHNDLQSFSYNNYTFCVCPLEKGAAGCFNHEERTLSIAPKALGDDRILLHEMIHLHDLFINTLPLFYRDTLYFYLYKDLRGKIPNLDDLIEAHSHILTEQAFGYEVEQHSVVFLLKSYDLDLRKGYPLGTVFGYGRGEWPEKPGQE